MMCVADDELLPMMAYGAIENWHLELKVAAKVRAP